MTAHSAGAFRGHDTQLRRRSVAFLYFLKIDSVRKILRSSLLRRCLWRSKLRLYRAAGFDIVHFVGHFADHLGHAGGGIAISRCRRGQRVHLLSS